MKAALLQRLRFGVTGNTACTPVSIIVEYSSGEVIEFRGEALGQLVNEITGVLMAVFAASRKEEQPPLFDNEQFRINQE